MRKTYQRMLALLLASMLVFTLAACGGEKESAGDTYTYNTALTDFPTNWSPFQYQTAIDDEILSYITEAFYVFDYNENKDGYRLVPGAAKTEPVDVTADYVGQYGIEEGETARAWKITLRDDLMWEDGTPIVAQDYVRSAELLLDPQAQNYRADSLYSGNLAIVNAQNFLYAGQYAYCNMISTFYAPEEYISMEDIVMAQDGTLTAFGRDILLKLDSCGSWDEENGLDAYYDAYPDAFMKDGTDLYTEVLVKTADKDGYIKLTQDILEDLRYIIGTLKNGDLAAYEAEAGEYAFEEWQELCFYGQSYPEIGMEEVGILASSDTELVLVLEKPLEGFYLLYALTSTWLVNEELYVSCASETDGVYTNNYGTSVETTISYGPYKLAAFQADKQFVLERNEHFHDVKEGYYQTTTWQVDCVAEPSTRLEMFLNGQLDAYGLSAEDMQNYATSDYTYYTTMDSTYFMALNPDREALEAAQTALGDNYNKTILTVKEFRQALSFSLDRSAFAMAAMPTCNPAFGIYSNLIVSNPETGEAYRSTEEAKWVLAQFWGVSEDIGEGKLYADVDEAVASITGYNPEKAKLLFNEAYDIAIAEGLMDEDDIIEVRIGLPNSTSQTYAKGYEFLVNCYTEAVKGTALEGKLTFSKDDTLGNGLSDALRANQVDMLFFVGWTGSALDPYNLMEAYTMPDYQYNLAWDTSKEMVSVNIDGMDYTASVADWTRCMAGTEITIVAADGTVKTFSAGTNDGVDKARFAILTTLESAVLSTYSMIPMVDDSTAALKGMQVQFYTEEYIFGVERGGIKYMTYHYTDAEWEAFVASRGGELIYN